MSTRPEPTIYGNCDMLELHFREIGYPVHGPNRRFGTLQRDNERVNNRISTVLVDIHLNNVWKPCG